MGFPEVLFNLFPGMGAYSFLQRKVGRRITEELITSGNTYTARELYDMGVVDVITPDGTGEAAVYSYVRRHSRGGNGRRASNRSGANSKRSRERNSIALPQCGSTQRSSLKNATSK